MRTSSNSLFALKNFPFRVIISIVSSLIHIIILSLDVMTRLVKCLTTACIRKLDVVLNKHFSIVCDVPVFHAFCFHVHTLTVISARS